MRLKRGFGPLDQEVCSSNLKVSAVPFEDSSFPRYRSEFSLHQYPPLLVQALRLHIMIHQELLKDLPIHHPRLQLKRSLVEVVFQNFNFELITLK